MGAARAAGVLGGSRRKPQAVPPPLPQPQPAPPGTFRRGEGAGSRSARCGGGREGRGASRRRSALGRTARRAARPRWAGQGLAGLGARCGAMRGARAAPFRPRPKLVLLPLLLLLGHRTRSQGELWSEPVAGARPPRSPRGSTCPQVCGMTAPGADATLHLPGRGPGGESSWCTGWRWGGGRPRGGSPRPRGGNRMWLAEGEEELCPKPGEGCPAPPSCCLSPEGTPGSPSTIGRSRGKFRFWDVQDGGIEPLPRDTLPTPPHPRLPLQTALGHCSAMELDPWAT